MTALMKFGGTGTGLMTRDALAGALNNAAMSMPRVGGDKAFLKLDKGTGEWYYGQDETPVEEGSLWAVNPMSFQHGYIAWDNNQQVEGEVMVPINRPLPATSALRTSNGGEPTGKDGWQFQMSVDLVCISGEDKGTECQYKQSSVGSIKLFNALTNALGGQLEAGADEIVPIIEMKSDSYKHKKYGRIYNPIFEIVDWRTMDDNKAPEPQQADPEPEEAEPPRRRRAAAPAAEEAPARQPAFGRNVPGNPPAEAAEADEDEDAKLAREYEQEAARNAAAGDNPAPRRRTRR